MGGSPRVVLRTAQNLPPMSWADELANLTDVWPYLGPTFLAGTEASMPAIKPWHTVATRCRGELAILPGYLLEASPAVDHDPRTYLGWQPPSGEEVCCGGELPCGRAAEVDALGVEAFFPCLLLGSPLGYRTEIAYNFWNRTLFGQLVTELVPAALNSGVRSIVAPWIPDRAGNDDLVSALVAQGGHATFWGYEDYVPLAAGSWDAHLAGLPTKIRQRITSDERRATRSEVEISRVDGEEIRPYVGRIAELTCLNREKNGAGEETSHIQGVLTSLLDARTDIRAYLGIAGGTVVGSCVALRKEDRLFPKWAGFDYPLIGERSGLYFTMVLNAPVRDAYTERLRAVEFGAGAHEAKRLRGCSSRAITTALLVSDPALRPTVSRFMDEFGQARHAAFGDRPRAPASSDGTDDVQRYYRDKAATAATGTSCCAPDPTATFGAAAYRDLDLAGAPDAALLASLGCGNPTAVAELREGETVLDLGSGGGLDLILSSRRVGPSGLVFGLDFLEDMLALARQNIIEAGCENVVLLKGRIEGIPLPADTVDVVISNCVINLATDKAAVFAELFRVLSPGGRIGLSDVVAEDRLSPADRAERGSRAECVAGALSVSEYRTMLASAGLAGIQVIEFPRRVADGMHTAIVRARKPT